MPEFRSILPRLRIFDLTICGDDGDADGACVQLLWFGFIVEVAIAREARRP